MRRSTRVRTEIPVRVRSLDPQKPFDIVTRTLIVNAQGCGLQSPSDLPVGAMVEMAVEDRVVRGRILNSTPIDPQKTSWVTGIEVDTPGNVWGLANPPADWALFAARAAHAAPHPFAKGARPAGGEAAGSRGASAPPSSALSDPALARSLAEEALRDLRARADTIADQLAERLRTQGSADWESLRKETEAALRDLQQSVSREVSSHVEQVRTDVQQAGDAVKGMAQAVAGRHETMLARLDAHEAELKVREQALTSVADGISAQISRQVEEAMGRLRAQIDETVARQEADLTARVSSSQPPAGEPQSGQDSVQVLYAAANRALEQLDERERNAATLNAEMVRAAEAALESIDQHRERAEASVRSAAEASLEKLKAELAEREREFDAKAQQAGWDYDAQVQAAGDRLDSRLTEALSRVDHALEEGRVALAAAAEAQRQAIGSGGDETIRADAERQMATFSEEAKRQADSLRRELEQAAAERSKDLDARHAAVAEKLAELAQRQELVNAQVGELQRLKQEIEVLGIALKDSNAENAQRHVTEAWERIKTDSETLIASTVAAEAERTASRVTGEIAASAQRLSQDMAAQAEKTAADLQARLADALASRQSEITRDVQAALDHAAAQFTVQAQRQAEEQQRAAEQIYESALRRLEEVCSRSETLLGETEAALLKSTQEVVTGEVARAQEEIRSTVAPHVEAAVARVRAESENAEAQRAALESAHETAQKRLEEAIERSGQMLRETEESLRKATSEIVSGETKRIRQEIQSATNDDVGRALAELRSELGRITAEYSAAAQTASDAVARLQQVQTGADVQADTLRKQLEEARNWLAQHTLEFQQSVHDAFLQAGGEIRGRVHAAVDTADEMILQKSRAAMAAMDSAGAQHAAKLADQTIDFERRIAAAHANVSAAAESALQEKLAETLQRFRDDAARLAQSAGMRWQSAIDETLRSLPDLLRARLEGQQDPKP